MKKKLLVSVFSLIMIMTMMPMQAFADTKGDLQNKKGNDEKIETEIGDTGIYLVGNEQAVDGKDYSLDNNTITIKTDPWEIKGENESISLNFDQVLGKNEYEVNNFLKVKSIALTYTTTFNIEGTIVIENNFSLGNNGNLSLNGKGHLIIEDGQLIGTDSNDCEINLNLFKVKNSNGAGINFNQGGSYATHSTLNITGGSVIVEGSTDGINFQNTSLSISENAAFYSYGKAGLPARSNMYLSESGMYGSDSPYSYAARNHMTQRVYDRGLKEHFYGWYQVYERAAKSIFHPAQKTEYPIEDTGITVKGDHEPITAEDYKEVIYQKDEKIVNIYDNLWEVSGENRDIEIRYEPLQNLETDDGVSIGDLRAKSFKVSSPKFVLCKVNITDELNLHKDFIFENNLTLSGSNAIISNGSLASPIDEPKQLTLDLKSLDVRNQDSQLNMGTAIFAGGVNVKQGKVIAITDVPPNEEDNLTGIAMIAANENIDIDNNAEVFAAGNYAGMLSNKNTHYDKFYYGNTVKMSYIENERVISHTNPVQKTVCGIYGYILNVSDSHNDNDAKTVYRPLNNHKVDMIETSAGTIKALVDGEPISKTVDIESQVLLKFIPNPGYKLTGWEVKGKSSGKTIEVNLNKFTMPREDVEVNVKVEGTTKYNILKEEPEWGTLSLSKTKASSGETIDITYSDKDEHETTLDKFLVSYINEEGKKEYVTVTKDADKGTFIMPGYEVTVTVSGKDNLHDITYTQPEGAVISGPTEGKVTNTVQLSSEVSQGFKLKNYLVSYNGHTDTLTPDEEGMAYFTMPNYEVNVSAEVETIFYNINVIQPEYGYLTVNKDSAMIDDVITLTYSESLMIALKSFVVTTETGKQVEVTPVKGVSNVVTFVMPPENVTVTATEALKHSIEIVNVEHGTITSDVSLAPSNTEVKLSCVTEQEYGLVNYIVKNKETQEAIEVSKDGAFIMPDADVVVTGVVKQKHSVDISDSEHGVVEVSESNPIEGTNITVIPKPEEGYKMRICSVIGQDTQTEIPLVDNVFVMPDEAVTVTALFMKDETKYSVEIEDSQFGETIATPVEGIPGTDIQLSSVPNEGYKLDSYEVTEQQTGMTVQVVDGKFKMPGDNVKVKAVYSLKNYNITITNPEHGIVTSDQESAVMGQEVKLSYEAISSGYHADKYIVFSAKGPIEVSEDGTFTMPAADVEVTAEESYGDYTISVTNPEHGTINVDSKTAMEGDIIQLSFTPEEGYELEHYNVTCAGKEVPIYNDGTFKMPAADVEVTATTKATKYFVAVAKATNGILTVDKTGASVGEEVAIQATADTGYKLKSLTVVDSKQNPIEITNNKFTMPADSVVVSAEFVPVEYDITVVQPKHGELFTNPAIKAKDGSEVTITYTPDVGWELDHFDVKDESGKSVAVSGNKFVMPESKVTVYAVEAQRLQHEVAFDMQGHGQQIASQEVYDGQTVTKPEDPQEPGYTFDGWFKEAACENEFDFSSPITADTTIYAKWTAIPYSIETRMTEGVSSISVQVEGTEAEQATVGTTVDVSALPEITYEIQNITITPSDTTIDPIVITGDQGSFTMPTSNVTVTATVMHVAQHEVAFDMQGHGSQIESQSVYDGQKATKPADPQEAGYTFDGWFKEAACENEFDFSSPITADTTIYAKWTAIPYNIETQMTEGVSSISVQVEGTEAEQATVGTTVDVSAMPDLSYRILNITIIPDSEIIDPIIVPGDFASFEMPACNVTVTATAVDPTITHTVTFDSQGGTEVLSQTVAEGEYATEPAAPIRSGYNFNGWFTTPEAAGTAFDFEKTPIIGDMTLYANWIKIPSVPQVTGLNAKATDSKTASVTWNRVKSVDGIKYEVWRSAGASGDFKKFAEVVSNSYKDTKVITGTKYIYKVRAICTVSGKTYTGKFSKVDYAYPRLFQVTHFSAKALNAAKTLMAWNSNGNKNVSYQVYRSTKPTSGFKKVVTITNEKTGYTQNIMPDQSGKKYYYKVRAITKDYTGKWHYGAFSKVDYAYPRVATPTNFKAWASSKHTCNCSWSKVSGSNIKYLVYRSTKSTGNFRKVATTIKTSFTNTNMKSGQKYYYRVRAVQTINGKNYYSAYSIKDYAYPR